jgi:hypothetical protein
MRAAGLKLAAAVVEGLPQTDRNMAAVQAEAWKLFEKQVKVGIHWEQNSHNSKSICTCQRHRVPKDQQRNQAAVAGVVQTLAFLNNMPQVPRGSVCTAGQNLGRAARRSSRAAGVHLQGGCCCAVELCRVLC